MPILSGEKGRPGLLAIPRRAQATTGDGVIRGGAPRSTRGVGGSTSVAQRPFRSPPFSTTNPRITGTTRDSAGTALAACTVHLFRTVDDQYLGEAVSDGSGNYNLTALGSGPFYIVAYKAGGTDVAGTSVNTLSAD